MKRLYRLTDDPSRFVIGTYAKPLAYTFIERRLSRRANLAYRLYAGPENAHRPLILTSSKRLNRTQLDTLRYTYRVFGRSAAKNLIDSWNGDIRWFTSKRDGRKPTFVVTDEANRLYNVAVESLRSKWEAEKDKPLRVLNVETAFAAPTTYRFVHVATKRGVPSCETYLEPNDIQRCDCGAFVLERGGGEQTAVLVTRDPIVFLMPSSLRRSGVRVSSELLKDWGWTPTTRPRYRHDLGDDTCETDLAFGERRQCTCGQRFLVRCEAPKN